MDEYIREKAIEWLKKNAAGRANAKPRRMLRNYIKYDLYFQISDRTLRRLYASMNQVGYSCSDPKGIYWITKADELREFKREQASRAVAIFARTKRTEIEVERVKQPGLF